MTVGITELPPEGMQLGGVALAGDADRGTKTTEGLSLLFTTAGITVQGPQPQIERLLVWSGLDTATCREKIALSDGRSAAVMELTSGGQSIRFLLPTETVTPGQAAYLDQALPAWLARYKGTTGSGPAPPRLHHRLPPRRRRVASHRLSPPLEPQEQQQPLVERRPWPPERETATPEPPPPTGRRPAAGPRRRRVHADALLVSAPAAPAAPAGTGSHRGRFGCSAHPPHPVPPSPPRPLRPSRRHRLPPRPLRRSRPHRDPRPPTPWRPAPPADGRG